MGDDYEELWRSAHNREAVKSIGLHNLTTNI
jgi:hypothetical protein